MDLSAQILANIQVAQMLIELGVTTYEKVRGYFASQGHDEETLAEILQQVDARIARRTAPPTP